ncbi:MAG: HAMP domain-containing histidine kinase [Dysgonamonadaceae bacterium]|nr:HAMP domain-containing histidine kinase [Dysgonamonadaceae bacterium]
MQVKQIYRLYLYLVGLIILLAGLLIGFHSNIVFIWLAACLAVVIVWLAISQHRTFIDSLNTLKYAVAYLRQHDRLPAISHSKDPNIREILDSVLDLHNDLTDAIGNIAHELRTPVSGVRGYLETLLEFKDMPEERRINFLQRALKQIIRLSDIIQNTELLTKASSSPQSFTKEPVNIYDMLTELVEVDLKEALEQQGFTVTLDLDKRLTVKGNSVLLYNIFRNLMDNALKYAGKNIHITIRSYSDDHLHYFSFADNGNGVAEEHLEHIFERFYQVNKGSSRNLGGSGLGLSIVKDAVTFHQGNIYAQNRNDGGLEFRFSLLKN